jgi:hypothetical protein
LSYSASKAVIIFFITPDDYSTGVPVHFGETIGPGLLAKILRDCDLNREQFKKLL